MRRKEWSLYQDGASVNPMKFNVKLFFCILEPGCSSLPARTDETDHNP
jgi:hypothetical protein